MKNTIPQLLHEAFYKVKNIIFGPPKQAAQGKTDHYDSIKFWRDYDKRTIERMKNTHK